MPILTRFITVPFQKEGIHYYPGADKDPALATGKWDDVSFLGSRHFHYFFFRVSIEVFENNREIEFIQFSRWVQKLYDNKTLQLNNKSCEMIAEDLIHAISEHYPGRRLIVQVYEDNINGSTLEFAP